MRNRHRHRHCQMLSSSFAAAAAAQSFIGRFWSSAQKEHFKEFLCKPSDGLLKEKKLMNPVYLSALRVDCRIVCIVVTSELESKVQDLSMVVVSGCSQSIWFTLKVLSVRSRVRSAYCTHFFPTLLGNQQQCRCRQCVQNASIIKPNRIELV